MGRSVGVEAGGTFRLIHQLSEWRDPIERELIDLGLRLRDFPSDLCNWRDLQVIVDQPAPGGFLFHVKAEAIRNKPVDQPPQQAASRADDARNIASAEEIIRDFT